MGGEGGAGGTGTGGDGGAGTGGTSASSSSGGGVCTPGLSQPCYSGPAGTLGVGICQAGTQTCDALGSGFGPCVGEVTPQAESCANTTDDNCDGQINEQCPCLPGSVASCYTGPAGTLGVGICKAGTQTCDAQGGGFGPCTGEITPQAAETCGDGVDDDCDGQADEGCVCTPGSTASCYTGPAGTLGVGICHGGTKTCNAQGTGYGPCDGEVTPQTESCINSADDDCDGQVNQGCACMPGTTASCYTGLAGTAGVGICQAGTHTCNDDGTAYGPCGGEVTPQAESCANTTDDNCDGQVNEGCACLPNSTASCYSGPAGTAGVGICTAGTKTCNAQGTGYGACTGEVTPQAESCANTTDDNCDGQVNEGCACTPGATASCYSGPAGTAGVGICQAGTKTCNAQGTGYGACTGEVTPQTESCTNTTDDNCDGQVNEGCVCTPNSTASCYSGPAGTAGVGICHAGTHTCNAQGTGYGPCTGDVTPQTESCTNTTDDNCDGQVNEGCVCTPNSTASCYGGPAGTAGVGICKAGTKTCNALGTAYGACTGEVTPQTESCANTTDDNCDGQVNEGCVCMPGSIASCYSGPAGTAGVGICQAGTHTCNAQGTAYGACTGEVTPQTEACGNSLDDDCDGQADEGCVCSPNSTTSCYDGPAGTLGVGVCKAGTKTCNALGTAYGACSGEVTPQTESCSNTTDDNCDGQVNEGCVCSPNSTASCYDGPAGTAGVGICKTGTKTCNAQGTAYGACTGEVTPQTESCTNTTDDNCDGQVNEGCICTPNSTATCYDGPAGTLGVGVCKAGTKTCNALGTAYGACAGETTPQAENCNTTADENCNGQMNDGCGVALWSHGWGQTLDDEGRGVALDGAGNVILGGYMNNTVDFGCSTGPLNSGTSADALLLLKLDAAGNCVWNKAWGAGAETQQIAADAAGNIYIVGSLYGTLDMGCGTMTTAGGPDILIAKTSPTGTCLWSRSFGDSAYQLAKPMMLDAAGNMVITGQYLGTMDLGCGAMPSAGATDVYLAKFDPTTGACLWSKRYGDNLVQSGNAVAHDAANNIVVAGSMAGTVNFGGTNLTSAGLNDAFVAKFTSAGGHLWSKRFGDSQDQMATGVAVDGSGNVVVVGDFAGTINLGGSTLTSAGGTDVWMVKFDASGNHLWSKSFGGAGNQNGSQIAIDAAGDIIITGQLAGSASFGGSTLTSAGGTDVFVAKYDPSGAHLWSKAYGDSASQSPVSIILDGTGNTFVTGLLTGTIDFGNGVCSGGGGEDIFIAKLSP